MPAAEALTPDEIATLRYHVETKGIRDVSEACGWRVEWTRRAIAGKPVAFVESMRQLLRDNAVTPQMRADWEAWKSLTPKQRDAAWERLMAQAMAGAP